MTAIRTFAAACLIAASLAGGVAAQTTAPQPPAERLVIALQAQGFDRIEIQRTWLGRIIISAESKTHEREIVIDPRTGEILRDYWELNDDADEYDDDEGGFWLRLLLRPEVDD